MHRCSFLFLFLSITTFLLAEKPTFSEKVITEVIIPPINEPIGFSNSPEGYIPPREIACGVEAHGEICNEESPSHLNWGRDILIDTSYIYDYDADYDEETGWMWIVVAPFTDSVIRLYRSTDHGLNWARVYTFYHTPRSFYEKVGLVVGRGDSNYVYIFVRHSINNGDIYLFRVKFDLSAWTHYAVATGADTINDFSVCRDYRSNYGLYCVHANEERAGANSKLLRSFTFGRTWDSQGGYDVCDPHISFGATRFLNVTARRYNANEVFYQCNRSYGASGYWDPLISVSFDTFNHYNPKVASAFTTPDSLATTWVLYEHDWRNTGDMDIWYAVRSHAWGDTWQRTYGFSVSSWFDEWAPDIKHYKSLGNIWVNATHLAVDSGYDDSSNVYRQWSDANNPTTWQGRIRVNDSATWAGYWFVGTGGPKIIYSPGAPTSGGGVLYCRAGLFFIPYGLYFDAPWLTGLAERKEGKLPMRIAANPAKGKLRLYPSPETKDIRIYDATGKLIKSFPNPKGSILWNGRDEKGKMVSSGIYIIKVNTQEGEAAEKLLFLR